MQVGPSNISRAQRPADLMQTAPVYKTVWQSLMLRVDVATQTSGKGSSIGSQSASLEEMGKVVYNMEKSVPSILHK